ncbi:glucose-1-phosphate adenylyltransferase subunit GlgD [Caldalkalibacillus mannanilyticus]|uniref:glucose-1-phosphate adenylyltransferase subunit GlgD n=1 Tax=Caldalkalibacillus mannanilyticus TaxID=1418 RepID=UPI00131F3B8B|nr:glucose-1-phosphate adenylyltransferase subunit GlgD [Caldalkalibacillus mannanilyticus]
MHSYYQHLDYFKRSSQKYVVLASSHMVCNMNYRAAVQFHKEKGAEVTLLYQTCTEEAQTRTEQGYLSLNEAGRVRQFIKETSMKKGKKRFLDMIVIDKLLLLDLIKACVYDVGCDLVDDILMNQIEHIQMYGFEHGGYVATMDCISQYFQHHLSLLNPTVYKELFFQPGTILTKVKDEPPTRYKETAQVHHSLVANGCLIEGTVENSILFRGVRVRPGATVKNSVIMQKCEIGSNAYLENVILDKEVKIMPKKEVIGTKIAPTWIAKRSVI